jgi:CheY-like chemotaxis protein
MEKMRAQSLADLVRMLEKVKSASAPCKRSDYINPPFWDCQSHQRPIDSLSALQYLDLWGWRGATDLISVVDDDESIRRTTKLLIESFGFRAAVFGSVADFLKSELVRETSCLVADIRMPGMNGLELQSHLAGEGCRNPIIFITVYDNKGLRGFAMRAGAAAFLRKPFDDEELCSEQFVRPYGTKLTKVKYQTSSL